MKKAEEGSLAEAYYAVVRKLGYTWDELLSEKCTRTFYNLRMLEEEAEKQREESPDMNSKSNQRIG